MGSAYYKKTGEGEPQKPKQAYPGDAGYDLFVSRDIIIKANSFTDVHTDLAIEMPLGKWGLITGRSSTIRKYHLRVENGIIDNGYRGEMFIGVWNHNDYDIYIKAGTRIAQLIMFDAVQVYWSEKDELSSSTRGENGFGHSGL